MFEKWRRNAGTPEIDARIKASAPQGENMPAAALVREAWRVGQTIDLKNAVYGPAHWKDGKAFHDESFPYYSFLAGLTRSQNCLSIFEIGTHYGGSSLAMLAGAPNAKLVTIDITDLNNALLSVSQITKLTGNANETGSIKKSILAVGSSPIDLLYIDADHRFQPTLANIALYTFLLRPRFVVIDDIVLNPEMRALWDVLRFTQGKGAINCVDIVPDIRSPNVGFGLIKIRE